MVKTHGFSIRDDTHMVCPRDCLPASSGHDTHELFIRPERAAEIERERHPIDTLEIYVLALERSAGDLKTLTGDARCVVIVVEPTPRRYSAVIIIHHPL